MSYGLYLSATVLRYIALELRMRPLLEDIGETCRGHRLPISRVSLHRRLLAAVPMVTWGTALIVAGLLTDDSRDLDTIGLASVVAVVVTAAVSIWLSFVLADAVSAPIIDLRDATRGSAPAIWPCACPWSAPMRRASSPRRSTRWSPGSASASGCVRRSAPS